MEPELYALHAEVEQRHWWFTARRRIMRAVLERAAPADRFRLVVDVGCGTGGNIAGLADRHECVGIDTSEAAIELARRRFRNVEFIHGQSPRDLGDRAGRVDVVLLMDVLEHVEDDAALLAAQCAAVRPGGLVLITVPADMALWSQHDERFGHYRRYDPARLRQAWAGLPVEERLCTPFNSRLYWLVRSVRAIGRRRGRTAGRSGTDLAVPPAPVNRLLERIFAGESNRLCRLLEPGAGRPYRRGVSLVALLEKSGGPPASKIGIGPAGDRNIEPM